MENNRYEERLGSEKMLPLILRMALPGVAAQLINLLYSIVDRVYIGHIPQFGTDALAGIGVTSSIIMLITAFSAIVGIGGAPLASIALGRGDRERAEYILGNGLLLLVIFSIITAAISYLFMEPILLFTGASQNTLPYATDYLKVYLIGTIFVQIVTGLNSFISAQGRPAIAMYSVLLGAVINIALDPIFIYTLNMGVKGAALATIISQCCSAAWILIFLFSKNASLRLNLKYLKPQKNVILMTLALGMSPFIMASTESLVGFVLNGSLKHFGDIHVSTMAIIQSALLFTTVPMTGFAQGFVPIVSYNYGRGNSARVKECFKISLIIMALFNALLTLFIILCPTLVSSIFTNDVELISVVREFMPIFFIGMVLFGIQRTCQNMFVALGEPKISIFIALLRKVILLIPLALTLPNFMGVTGIYTAEAVADAIAAIICTIIFFAQFPRILKKGEFVANKKDTNNQL